MYLHITICRYKQYIFVITAMRIRVDLTFALVALVYYAPQESSTDVTPVWSREGVSLEGVAGNITVTTWTIGIIFD